MLENAVVLPWPPALVPELMGRAAGELTPLRRVIDGALSDFNTELMEAMERQGGAQLVVVGPGEPAEHDAVGALSFADFGRDVPVPVLAGHDEKGAPAEAGTVELVSLPTPLMVARYLAWRVLAGVNTTTPASATTDTASGITALTSGGASGGGATTGGTTTGAASGGGASSTDASSAATKLWAGARWLTTDAAHAQELGERLAAQDVPVGLVLLADGAACHGPKAPRAEDSRAERYDEMVARALADADPAALLALDLRLGEELGSSGAPLWPLLARAAGRRRLQGQVRWRGAPYGVGWTVASWRSGD